MLNLQNPIPRLQRDPRTVQQLFDIFGIIPYYGTSKASSHRTLRLFYDLSKNSPSNRACMRDKKMYAFQSGLKFLDRSTPGLYQSDFNEVNPNEAISIFESYNLPLTEIVNASGVMLDHYNECGNIWLKIKLDEVAGERFITFEPIHYLNCALLKTEINEPKQLVITESWDKVWWAKHPPDVIPVSESGDWNWSENMETVFHVKNEGSIYYGRPIIESVLEWLAVEFLYSSLTAKISSTEIISKNVIALEDVVSSTIEDDDNEDDRSMELAKTLRKLTTVEGKHGEVHSLATMTYPNGTNQPTVLNFDVNRDYRYQEMAIDQASSYIYSIHGWDKSITGFSRVRSQLGSEAIINTFMRVNFGTIYPLQSMFSSIWNEVMDECMDIFGDNRQLPGISFKSLADIYIEKYESDSNA
jgi:hypothetical protein